MKNPVYSIIVPSYNREEEIRELLNSFLALDFPKECYELIIADDGSTDDTRSIVELFQQQHDVDLHFFHQQNQGPGAARNMGMSKARGTVFVFIDSDCTVSSQWLKAIDEGLRSSGADAFGGPDSYLDSFPALLKAINYSMTSFITTGGIRGHKQKKLGKYYPRSFNMGLTRATYDTTGGFGALRHGQDIEFSHRIISSGAKVILIDDAVVYHKRRTSLRKFFRQVYNWGVARINLYKIDAAMLEAVHALPAIATVGCILLVITGSMFDWLRPLLWASLAGGGLVLLLSGIHAAVTYRTWRMLYLVPIVMPIQVFGYGLGFSTAFISRVLFGAKEFTGFTRRYYS